MKKCVRLGFILSLVLFVAVGAVFAEGEKEEKTGNSGTLVVARSADSRFLDSAFSNVGEDADVAMLIFDPLVSFDDMANIIPALAESWETSNDGLTWTFHLRKGIKFHDGTPFNADAVVVSYTRQEESSPYYFYPGRRSSFDIYLGKVIKSIEAVDENTVRIVLVSPFPALLTYLASNSAIIVSPTALQSSKENFFNNPVGTGPFKLGEWIKDDHITLVANKDYWQGAPSLDEIVFKVVPDVSSRFLELKKGSAHIVRGLTPDQIEMIEKEKDLRILRKPSQSIGYVAINVEKEPFDNVLVRRAVNHAIDREAILRDIMRGQASPADTPLPPWMPENNEKIPGYEYNPEKAKQLLSEAGYPDGFTTELWAFAFSRFYLPNSPIVAQKIQYDLKQVGIDAKLSTIESAIYWELVNTLRHTLAMKGWYPPPDPDALIRVAMLSEAGTGYGKTPAGQELIEKALQASQTLDSEKRIQMYKDILWKFYEDASIIPLCHADYVWGYSKNVQNLKISIVGDTRELKNVKLVPPVE